MGMFAKFGELNEAWDKRYVFVNIVCEDVSNDAQGPLGRPLSLAEKKVTLITNVSQLGVICGSQLSSVGLDLLGCWLLSLLGLGRLDWFFLWDLEAQKVHYHVVGAHSLLRCLRLCIYWLLLGLLRLATS